MKIFIKFCIKKKNNFRQNDLDKDYLKHCIGFFTGCHVMKKKNEI